jgi:hypothetical protein
MGWVEVMYEDSVRATRGSFEWYLVLVVIPSDSTSYKDTAFYVGIAIVVVVPDIPRLCTKHTV